MNLRVLNLSALAIVFMSFLFLDLARAQSPQDLNVARQQKQAELSHLYQTLGESELSTADDDPALRARITTLEGEIKTLNSASQICLKGSTCNFQQVNNNQGGAPVPNEARAKMEEDESDDVEGGPCGVATRNANAGCNPNENPGLKSAISMADQVAGPGGMASSMASSPQAACGGMNQVLGAVNGGLLTFKGYCSAKFFSCSSACSAEIKETEGKKKIAQHEARTDTSMQIEAERLRYRLTVLQKVNRSCQANAENLGSAMINIVGIVKTIMVAKQCEQMALNSTEALCKKYPHAAICTGNKPVDCADPQMRMSNVVCICMTNPSDSRCGGGGIDIVGSAGRGGGGRAGSGAADGVGGAGLGGGAMPLDLASESNGMGNVAPGRAADPKGGTLGGGSGGNKSGLSGDTGSPKGNPGVAGREPPNKNINSGYYGGGSGGGSYSGGRYGGGGSYGSTSGAANPNFDLKPYLPNGKLDATRGLANSAGPDGITGPNSNIWQKVKVRYYTVSPSLLP